MNEITYSYFSELLSRSRITECKGMQNSQTLSCYYQIPFQKSLPVYPLSKLEEPALFLYSTIFSPQSDSKDRYLFSSIFNFVEYQLSFFSQS